MKGKIIFLSIIAIVILQVGKLQAQTEGELKKFDEEKFTLVQRLLTCQSMAYTTMNENDYQKRYLYMNLGSKNYNYAYKAFIQMQGCNVAMDEKLIKKISTLLQLYSKSFESVDALNSPEMALGISFGKESLENVVIKLYEK